MTDFGVLFDVDDTLVDFSGAARSALLDVAAMFPPRLGEGPSIADLVLASWEVVSEREYGRFLADELTFDAMLVSRMAAVTAEMDPAGDLGLDPVVLERLRNESIFTHYRQYPDVTDTLRRFRDADVPVGVLSNSDGDYQRRKMVAAGLGELVPGGVFSGDVGIAKPEAGIFLAGARSIGMPPERVLYVGDRWATDALGALGAGLAAVWVNRDGSSRPADAQQRLDGLPGSAVRVVELPDLTGLDVGLARRLVSA
ncbi:putative hydrolase of the HAD superfamily [Nakamurella sp. UYEF19]|uniref:HAD family hydrolase n=1 Tax=Nakamurella sp. UYEF19 TaxID=1756392 RepID=UPI0033952E89